MEITWTSVKDSMPKKSGWYLVTYNDKESVTTSYWNKQQKKWLLGEIDMELLTVSAWANMPAPFKG